MSAAVEIARLSLKEGVRRRVFAVVLVLTLAFLGLYALAVHEVFHDLSGFVGAEHDAAPEVVAGGTMLGLATFATLFLGAVLATFLTLGAVRGDAERGLLAPVVVRPLGRSTYLAGRFLGAAAICAPYVAAVFVAAAAITAWAGSWTPDRIARPALLLALAVCVVIALALLGSALLSATANGIAVFMVFGAGLVAGLLGQIGDALSNDTLVGVAHGAAWALPFEALYQQALHQLTQDTGGVAGFLVSLGPFGGAHGAGPLLVPWAAAYVVLVGGLAAWAFARRDL